MMFFLFRKICSFALRFFSIYISAARSSIRPGSWTPISERIPGANFPRAVEDSLVNFSCWCFLGGRIRPDGGRRVLEQISWNKFSKIQTHMNRFTCSSLMKAPKPKAQETTGNYRNLQKWKLHEDEGCSCKSAVGE